MSTCAWRELAAGLTLCWDADIGVVCQYERRGQEPTSLIGDLDLHLFNEGSHDRLYEKLGAHLGVVDGRAGTRFAVWAPNAHEVSVIGDFNGWSAGAARLEPRDRSGIWEGFVPGVGEGALYKYAIRTVHDKLLEKADPFGFFHEIRPRTASVVASLSFDWKDGAWMQSRGRANALDAPHSIYEVHLGSWRHPIRGYREIATELAEYVSSLGFTHVEIMPIMEHPFDGSWGYQVTGYFAPTSRYGTPQDFMAFVDELHRHGIGVILDWVPAHFPNDGHGLHRFDGTSLFEHTDAREGFHPEWKTSIFNYGRHEVRSFLISSAAFWFDRYHIDGLRVDGVASMLYRDYARRGGEWIPNRHGGRENLEAIDFLRQLNETVYRRFPDVQTIAEESTAWPMVTRPTYVGGLGFGLKWDMGWMNDTLRYMSREAVHRKFHHGELTFRSVYAHHENFVLPLSHDEVVHGKGSLLGKMPGDDWQKFANLRLLLAYQYGQPGKKLLFMGSELAPWSEWDYKSSLDWHFQQYHRHAGIGRLVADLNRCYRERPALHQGDVDGPGLEWIEANDEDQSVLVFARVGMDRDHPILCAFNFTPVPRHDYRVGVEQPGTWREILNTDACEYGGTGMGNCGAVSTAPEPFHGRRHSLVLTLPPLAAVFLTSPGHD